MALDDGRLDWEQISERPHPGTYAIVGAGPSLSYLEDIPEDFVIAINNAALAVERLRPDAFRIHNDGLYTGPFHQELAPIPESTLPLLTVDKPTVGLTNDEPSVVLACRIARLMGATGLVLYCLDSFFGDCRTWTPSGIVKHEQIYENQYPPFKYTLMHELDPNATGVPWRFAWPPERRSRG